MTYGIDYPAEKPVSQDPPVRPARAWIAWLIVLANVIYAAILTGHRVLLRVWLRRKGDGSRAAASSGGGAAGTLPIARTAARAIDRLRASR